MIPQEFQPFIEQHNCQSRGCTEKRLLFCVENNVCLEDSILVEFKEIKNELMIINDGVKNG